MRLSSQRGLSVKKILIVGVATGLLTLLALSLTGATSDAKALRLIDAMMPSVRFFASSAITAAATVLALMVAALSFSRNFDHPIDETHYTRLRQLSLAIVVVFLAALLLLSFVTLPLSDADDDVADYFIAIYYALVGYTALLTGALAASVWMLYELVVDMISIATGDTAGLVTESGSGSAERPDAGSRKED